jgi:hypothetical protein
VSDRVHVIAPEELRWTFNDDQRPKLLLDRDEGYKSWQAVDPTPAYTHDAELVEHELKLTEQLLERELGVEMKFPPVVYVLPFEPPGRTNGWAEPAHIYGTDEDPAPWVSRIILTGKRIPIHPAMTRYLVAHEYGHHVEYELSRRRGLGTHTEDVLQEYAEMRGMEFPENGYGPGSWHLHPQEVFANDFRVLIAKAEREFWPHEVAYPDKAVLAWWKEAFA